MLSFIADLMIVVYCSLMFFTMLFVGAYAFKSGESANPDKRIEYKLDKLLAHYENEKKNVENENDVPHES